MEATHFITVQNGVVTGQHCGDIGADFFGTPYHGHERIPVPADATVSVLDMAGYYTADWKRRPDAELVVEGIMPMPEGWVIDGGELRPMTDAEKIGAGLMELPEGCLIENGVLRPMTEVEMAEAGLLAGYKVVGGEAVPMSRREMLKAGQITVEEYEADTAAENGAELQRRIGDLQTPETLARAEVDEAYARKRKAVLVALLAVKEQPGWPLEVKWPE